MQEILFFVKKTVPTAFVLLLGGCALFNASKPVAPDHMVRVQYACRTADDGLLMATTQKGPAEDPGVPKAAVFEPPADFGPVTLKTGPKAECPDCPEKPGKTSPFLQVLHETMAEAMVGLFYDKPQSVRLIGKVPERLPKGSRYVGLARVWERPKQTKVLQADYEKMMGKTPEPGFQFMYDLGLRATVADIQGGKVIIRFDPTVTLGGMVPTPFCEGIIRDGGSHWKIHMQVTEGQLVRTGDLIGKVVEVTDTMFYIDFGHPFGGKELVCDVTIHAVP